MRTITPTALRAVGAALMMLGTSPCGAQGISPTFARLAGGSPALDSVRAALEKYADPIAAVHDGYFSTVGCVAIPRAGAADEVPYRPGSMGVHFLNTSVISPVPDPGKPQILIYEPRGDQLRLVAAEWFIPLATGVKERPVLFGHSFDGPMAGHHPLMPEGLSHYDLHVWLFKPNPYGVFSATNPDVKCGRYGYTSIERAPKLVSNPNH